MAPFNSRITKPLCSHIPFGLPEGLLGFIKGGEKSYGANIFKLWIYL